MKSQIHICSCAYEAIENYLEFRSSGKIYLNGDPSRMYILDSRQFPQKLVDNLMSKNFPSDTNILEHLNFENQLCHECNKVVPEYRYCVEMYGGQFKQTYGWYINKQAYELGFDPVSGRIIPKRCPNEIVELLEIDPSEYRGKFFELVERYALDRHELSRKFQKQMRKIWAIIENKVRMKFEFPKIGEGWTSETILYYIVKSLFKGKSIERHYRPTFLEGLELDIFIPELNLGIEYQGFQHFKPVKHWGGKKALLKLKERDKKKKSLCEENGVQVIYFNYDEPLDESLILDKLNSFIND